MSTPTLQPGAWFLDWLYDDGRGYMEVVAGQANPHNPEKIDLVMRTRRWCYYDPERPDLRDKAAGHIAELAQQYGNVYVGCRLYTKEAKDRNERSEARTLPSRVIFIDDALDEPYLRYSLSVRTSEGSLHAYYKADQPTTKADARRAARYLDGDPSGVDLTQLVRVPGTFNTKHNTRFLVEIEDSGPVYRLDDLRAKFPQVEPERAAGGATIEALHWPEVEAHLANMDALLGCARSQLIKPETQTGRILAGEMLPIGDGSRSMNGFAAIYGFYLRGYPDDELAAIGIHLYRKWGVERDKGTAWCKVDVARMIAKCHEKMPGVKQSPTRYRKAQTGQPIADVKPVSRARQDRPQRFTAAALYLEYEQRPELCDLKRKARAAALSISTATLDRLEDALETESLIEIFTDPQRQGSRVILRGVINIAPAEVLSAAPAQSADEPPNTRSESGQTAIDTPQCIGETRPPPDTPGPAGAGPWLATWHAADADYPVLVLEVAGIAADGRVYVWAAGEDGTGKTGIPLDQVEFNQAPPTPAPPLDYLVRQAIRAIEQPAVDPKTGEIKQHYWRATPDRVRAWLAERWPDLDTTEVESVYSEVRKALQDERKRAQARAFWAGERQRVSALDNDPLLAALSGCASRLAAAEAKRPGSPWAKRCAALFAIHDDERRRRGLAADAPRDRASRRAATDRTVKIAQILHRKPERPEAPTQAAFVNLVEDLAWLPPLDPAPTAAGVSPLPAAAPIDPSGIVGRLKAQRDARQSTGGD